jgi:cell wall-associated NlpC family hydrolase
MTYQEYFCKVWPEEGVGYIKDNVFFPLENISENKLYSFEVNPDFLLLEPDVLIHSHVTGTDYKWQWDARSPSYEDLVGQLATDIEWAIVTCDGENCSEPVYWGNPDNRPDLVGRDYIFNMYDCFSLCQDWLYKEFDLIIPTIPRTPFWDDEGQNYMEDLYDKMEGFNKKIPLNELERGDILFYKVRSPVVNHLAIYLGDNQVLSHWYQRTSCIEDFGKWARYIQFAARYHAKKD